MIIIILVILGLTVLLWPRKRHKWTYGQHACSRTCIKCGEKQDQYMLWVTPPAPDWWETTRSGDGSCGIPELPSRYI